MFHDADASIPSPFNSIMPTGVTQSDDTVPSGYPYSWSASATLSIEEFSTKYKPSMVQNDGTKPWIWVRCEEAAKSSSIQHEAIAIIEAAAYLGQVTERIEEIKNDTSIPVRGNKKTGTRSKKEVREQLQAEATRKLRDISKKYGYVCGKWLIFAPSDKVDVIWSKIASSLVSGPLSSTSAFCAKVATSPVNATPRHQHVICVYIPDVYDKEDVTAVMKVLLRHHGLNLSGIKSDLYTIIGLDSKHPSGIPSTVWKNVALLEESEIKELKEAFYTKLPVPKATTTAAANLTKDSKPSERKLKSLMKRKTEEDPFASDDEITSANVDEEGNSEETDVKFPVKKKRIL